MNHTTTNAAAPVIPAYTKPLPVLDVWNKPFWEACKEGRFIAQRCNVSGEVFYPPAPISPVTHTTDWSWVELSGRGTIFSWVSMHQLYFKSFAAELPYLVAQIQLDEGPMLISNLVAMSHDEARIGAAVKVVFSEATEAFTIPKFTLARE